MTWSPNSKEFGVIYGYMPAKTTIFNARGSATKNFPLAPRNTIVFSPHGRFVVIAGFGNLAGQMDIYDLEQDYKKIATIEAANASVCKWSPDGKHILTATTSPRLRVDNGIRIWHVNGKLMYNEDMNELYHVCWRSQSSLQQPLEDPFQSLPTPHSSALDYLAKVKTPSKPAGAYRPPGARGQVTPLAFRREDEGGAAFVRDSAPAFGAGTVNGFSKSRRRDVPGAEPAGEYVPPGAAPGGGVALPPGAETEEKLPKSAAKNKKKREAKKARESAEKNYPTAEAVTELAPPRGQHPSPSPDRRGPERNRSKAHNNTDVNHRKHHGRTESGANRSNGASTGLSNKKANNKVDVSPVPSGPAASAAESATIPPTTPGDSGGTSQDKRIRGLLKKIRAIDELKMRLATGEKLEDTQMKKIATENVVRMELESLGYDG